MSLNELPNLDFISLTKILKSILTAKVVDLDQKSLRLFLFHPCEVKQSLCIDLSSSKVHLTLVVIGEVSERFNRLISLNFLFILPGQVVLEARRRFVEFPGLNIEFG